MSSLPMQRRTYRDRTMLRRTLPQKHLDQRCARLPRALCDSPADGHVTAIDTFKPAKPELGARRKFSRRHSDYPCGSTSFCTAAE